MPLEDGRTPPIPKAGRLGMPKSLTQAGVPIAATQAAIPADNPQTPKNMKMPEYMCSDDR
jgi:hypothetical protein